MSSLLLLFIFVPVLTGILLALNLLLAVHRPDSEKVQAYECGFSPIYGQTRAPFHVQFYLVGILFLIFDLEILLIYPLAVTLYQVSTYGFWITMIFFAILTVGFVLEIGSGALYFTEQKTAVVSLRPEDPSPLNPSPKSERVLLFGQINHGMAGSRLIHTNSHFL
jgi:NADH:ubiquinone oxidoreductase subunit 3 (subunit A)